MIHRCVVSTELWALALQSHIPLDLKSSHRAQMVFMMVDRKRPVFVTAHMGKTVCHSPITKEDWESNEDSHGRTGRIIQPLLRTGKRNDGICLLGELEYSP